MPNIGSFHPQIVHFVIALLFVGLAFRIVSLFRWRWLDFTNYAATALILIGTAAAVLAVKSGTDAHGPVERIPGVRPAVVAHEEHGESARNVFLGVAAIELIALGLLSKPSLARYARWAHVASAALGIFGAIPLYEAGEHGGELVYSYAGGPGLRSGEAQDVERLLMAGLYNQSRIDRREKRHAEAATLVNEMVKRFPNDTNVKFLRVESLMLDTRDYSAAVAALDSISVAPNDARMAPRYATVKADLYLAMGKPDSARAALSQAVAAFPQNRRLKIKLDSIKP
jgi:uncharacterized membrane protein